MHRPLILGIALMVAACGGDQPTSPASHPTIPGSYQLTTVDGHSLPVTLIDLGTYRANLASSTLTLNGDGTYTLEYEYQLDDGVKIRAVADDDVGTWTVAGEAITLASSEGNFSVSGTASQNAVTLVNTERVLVFRK